MPSQVVANESFVEKSFTQSISPPIPSLAFTRTKRQIARTRNRFNTKEQASDLALGQDDLGWDHRQNSPRAAKARAVVEATASPRHHNARVRSAYRAGTLNFLGAPAVQPEEWKENWDDLLALLRSGCQ